MCTPQNISPVRSLRSRGIVHVYVCVCARVRGCEALASPRGAGEAAGALAQFRLERAGGTHVIGHENGEARLAKGWVGLSR